MSDGALPSRAAAATGFGYAGFVAFVASVMALNGLSIDSMLPALPEIGTALGVADENRRQLVIVAYMLSFGAAQIVWGPLADRFGRRPILLPTMLLYAVFSAAAAFAGSFGMLLAARVAQGIVAAAARVLLVSIVRDSFSGRTMARVMSLAFVIFLAVPILAPSIGQVVVAIFGSWRAIFLALAVYALATTAIAATRLRETLHPEYRHPLRFAGVLRAMRRVATERTAIGYTLAAGVAFGCVAGFITSVQQIFADVFHEVRLFPALFAGMVMGMGAASLLNARFVERYGSRRISHMALLCFLAASAVHLALAASGIETIATFAGCQLVQMFFFGFLGANFNSMAMEPVGDIAGAASSVQGFLSTCIGAVLGAAIGQSFDGTTVPLAAGFLILGGLSLALVLWAERGRLFHARHAQPARVRGETDSSFRSEGGIGVA